jgi:hypothetical protein
MKIKTWKNCTQRLEETECFFLLRYESGYIVTWIQVSTIRKICYAYRMSRGNEYNGDRYGIIWEYLPTLINMSSHFTTLYIMCGKNWYVWCWVIVDGLTDSRQILMKRTRINLGKGVPSIILQSCRHGSRGTSGAHSPHLIWNWPWNLLNWKNLWNWPWLFY